MKGKKCFSFAAALILLLSASVPAMAAKGGKASTKISATAKLPTIRMVVPSSRGGIINPYSLTIKMKSVSKSDPVIYPARALSSLSDVPVDVKVTVRGTAAGGMTLESSSAENMDSKAAYMYLEMKKFNATAANYDKDGYLTTDLEKIDWVGSTQEVLQETESTIDGAEWRLPPPGKDGNPAAYIAYRFAGDVASSSDLKWTTSDKVTLNVAFTFTAVPYTEYDG